MEVVEWDFKKDAAEWISRTVCREAESAKKPGAPRSRVRQKEGSQRRGREVGFQEEHRGVDQMAGYQGQCASTKRQRPSSSSEQDNSREDRRAARRKRNEDRRIRREQRIKAAVSEVQMEASTESASSAEQWVSTVVVLKMCI